MLKIKNIDKIIGEAYNGHLNIIAVKEHKLYYEFTLGVKDLSSRQSHTILIHKKPTESGHYIMKYNSKNIIYDNCGYIYFICDNNSIII